MKAFEIWALKNTEKISWSKHINNDEEIVNHQRPCIRHVLRSDSLMRTMLEVLFDRRKTRERPKTTTLQWTTEEKEEKYCKLKRLGKTKTRGIRQRNNVKADKNILSTLYNV